MGVMSNQNNIYQIEGDKLSEYGFLDYIKKNYQVMYDKYIMIQLMAPMVSNTLLDSVFVNMCQMAIMAGYNYIMIMI